MKCEYINLFIHDYMDNYLSEEQSQIIEIHIKTCINCRQKIKQARCQKEELINLMTPDLSDEFTERALQDVETHFLRSKTRALKKSAYYFSMAACILFVSVAAFLLPNHSVNSTSNDPLVISFNQQEVNMVFNTPKELQNVKFTIILPRNVEMLGHPGKRYVIWSGALNVGPNLLSIPVLSRHSFSGILTTKLEYEKNSKTFNVNMKGIDRKQTT